MGYRKYTGINFPSLEWLKAKVKAFAKRILG